RRRESRGMAGGGERSRLLGRRAVPLVPTGRLALIVAAILAAAMQGGTASWATLRASIAQEICVVRYPGGVYGASIGDRTTCGAAPATTPADKAVDSALVSAMPLLVSVPPAFTAEPKGLTEAYAEKDEGKRN